MTKPRRRQAGEGGISQYATKGGPRFLIKYTAPSEDGSKRVVLKRGYLTRKAAAEALREQLSAVATGTHVRPNKVTVGEHFTEWAAGLRLAKGSVASYQQMLRNHVIPHIGSLRLDQLTGTKLDALYRQLEQSGRVNSEGGLSPPDGALRGHDRACRTREGGEGRPPGDQPGRQGRPTVGAVGARPRDAGVDR